MIKLREDIDIIDNKIIELLEQRLELVKEIGIYKKEKNLEVLDSKREEIIINKINCMDIKNKTQIIEIYINVMRITKDMQKWKNMVL
ncbi:MAG: chorismate mutase [Mycoplasmatales bacterium]